MTSSTTVTATEDHTLHAQWTLTAYDCKCPGCDELITSGNYCSTCYDDCVSCWRCSVHYTLCPTCGKCTDEHCEGHSSSGGGSSGGDDEYEECFCCGENWYTCSCSSTECDTCRECTNHCDGHDSGGESSRRCYTCGGDGKVDAGESTTNYGSYTAYYCEVCGIHLKDYMNGSGMEYWYNSCNCEVDCDNCGGDGEV